MPEPILTISIPTFDRPESLIGMVGSLLAQTDSRVQVRIFDNSSELVVAELVTSRLGSEAAARIDIRRNAANVGANANIMRCIEYCETTWLWILGDDDELLPDSVNTALNCIGVDSEAVLINFRSRPGRADSFSTFGLAGFVDGVDFLDEVVFISTNILNAAALKSSVRFGCHLTASSMPHVVTLLRTLGDSGLCRFVTEQLVQDPPLRESAQSYSFITFCLGCGLLLDTPMPVRTRRTLARKLHWKKTLSLRMYFHLALMRKKGDSIEELHYHAWQVYHRWLRHCEWPLFRLVHRCMLLPVTYMPDLFARFAVGIAARHTSKRPTMEDLPDAVSRL